MRVDFYTGPEFLRSKQRTNPFIDPIIAVCKANRIEYRVFVPSIKIKCGYDEAHVKSYRFIVFVHTWAWRISRLLCRVSGLCVRRFAGSLVKFLWKDSFSSDVAVIMAGGAECFLYWSLNVKRIVDLQHGVIYSRHRGYFDPNGRFLGAVNKSEVSNLEFWLFGQGYADCFFKHPDNIKDLQGRVKIIGDVVRAGEGENKEGRMKKEDGSGARNLVVFSAQLTADLAREEMVASVNRMEEFFDEFFKKFGDRYECFVKHHPRFANVYDMTGFFAKFPQVEVTKAQWAELYPRMALHVTFTSTVTFDCASVGVPTYLLEFPVAKILHREFWCDDYNYPYFDKTVGEILAIPAEETRRTMVEWYRKFYSPFDEKNCLQLLRGDDAFKPL